MAASRLPAGDFGVECDHARLQSLQTPLAIGGYSQTFAARWDAEWNKRLFTSIDYQHQDLRDLSIPIPAAIEEIALAQGTLDRVSGTVNVNLPHGFGAFGSLAYTRSRNETPGPGFGDGLPFVPELTGRVGVSWVHPANLKLTLAASYVGERASDLPGRSLEDYWTLDTSLRWESDDKRFAVDLAAYNLLGQTFEVGRDTAGWGRTFTGSLKVRF